MAGAPAFLLAACSQGVLAPVGPVSDAERTILLDSVAIMLAIIVPVILATLAFAWWFRSSNDRAIHLPNWS
jgi:cytochrome o ubiquinol oxidase subunit 2